MCFMSLGGSSLLSEFVKWVCVVLGAFCVCIVSRAVRGVL